MLIYEKDNKLNINFENSVDGEPDLQIGKNGDKTEVLVDGNINPTIPVPVLPEDVGKAIIVNEDGSYTLANAGGSNAPLICTDTLGALDKTMGEIMTAFLEGRLIYIWFPGEGEMMYTIIFDVSPVHLEKQEYVGHVNNGGTVYYGVIGETEAEALSAYPVRINTD